MRPSPRSTRSSRLRNAEPEVQEEVVEPIVEEVGDPDVDMPPESSEMTELVLPTVVELPDDDASFPFGEEPQSAEELNTTANNSSDVFIANLAAEENANSLPSINTLSNTEISETNNNIENNLESQNSSQEQPRETTQREDEEETEDTSADTKAIAEDLTNGQDSKDSKLDNDAEMVSEDEELPGPVQPKVNDAEEVSEDELPKAGNQEDGDQPKVKDAEEVSDDELPAPKRAELPADTEVVSEDELPAAAKGKRKHDEGYDPSSPTTEEVSENKKQKTGDKEKGDEADTAEEPKKVRLPDLDKFWKTVNDDPTDFAGWTYLLQYVDQESDVEAAREAYDAFLAHYPYCYGYWRKYSDYEKYKGNKKKCEEVFERGLKAIPLSVDLWIHYLTYVKANHTDNEEFIRSQFERALTACGLEFRSDKLWEAYIKWETEGKRLKNVVKVYDRLLATPTLGYGAHFTHFTEVVNGNAPNQLIGEEEMKALLGASEEGAGGEEEQQKEDDKETKDKEKEKEKENKKGVEDETLKLRKKILSGRKKVYKQTVAAVSARWTFEEAIKRPYFHVKPLERSQLKNWKDYLDFEIEQGDRKRTLVLFERCLIACALYDEFWLKLIRYLDTQTDTDLEPIKRDAYERACTVHHPDKPSLHLMWSAFEECHENFAKAAEILTNLEKVAPNLLQIAYRRINLERRRGDLVKSEQLYEQYISTAKGTVASSLAIKYARFVYKVQKDLSKGLSILKAALEKEPNNVRIALQMIDLAFQRDTIDEQEIVAIMDEFLGQENLEPDQKVLFAQRKVEFLEDFGKSALGLQDAQRALQTAIIKANEQKKKDSASNDSKKGKEGQAAMPPTTATPTSAYSAYNYPTAGSTPAAASYYGNSTDANAASYGSYADANYNSYSSQWNQQYGAQAGYSSYGYGNYY